MNVAIIGNIRSNAAMISKLSEKITGSGNTVKCPPESVASDSVDAELIESFERIDWADMVIAVPKVGLAFTHDTTAELAYAKHKRKTVFIYYG